MSHTKVKYAIWFACAILILFSESLLAQGGPPLVLTDPGTPGPGNWEINLLASLERSDVKDEWQIPLLDINYGVGDRWQLTASIPYAISDETDVGIQRAFDGIALGVKYRFVDNPDATGSNFAFFPQVHLSFGDENQSTKWTLPLEWHREWKHLGLTAEVGHIWVNGESDGWEGGMAAALLLDPVSLLVEGHTSVREVPFDLRGPMIIGGFTWK